MNGVAPVKADSMSELVLGRSDDRLFNMKVTNSRMRYVNDRNAILQRIVRLYNWPNGRAVRVGGFRYSCTLNRPLSSVSEVGAHNRIS